MTPPHGLGDWTSQLRRGVLELCVLRLIDGRPHYGYELVSALDRFAPLASGENTLYPLLRRLKTDGLLDTFTEDSPTGPPRQYYRTTTRGRKRLEVLETEWRAMVDAVQRIK